MLAEKGTFGAEPGALRLAVAWDERGGLFGKDAVELVEPGWVGVAGDGDRGVDSEDLGALLVALLILPPQSLRSGPVGGW